MSSAAYQVAGLLEKMSATDKDFRFMAVNDLMRQIQDPNFNMDEDTERKIIRAVSRLLVDRSGEVQNLTVKFIGVLISRVKEAQADYLIDLLLSSTTQGSDDEKDISSLALKTIVTSLGVSNTGTSIALMKKLLPKLLVALSGSSPSSNIRIEILDIISDLLMRFGSSLDSLHEQTYPVLFDQLKSERQAVRKRATLALSHLTAVSPSYNNCIKLLLEKADETSSVTAKRTYVVALTYVARSSGTRFAPHISKVVTLMLSLLAKESNDDDLKEAIMQAFDVFYQRCPTETSVFENEIMEFLVKNLTYDPNYCVDYEEDEDECMEVEDEEDMVDDYSDDDDMSWKVRRAAAKGLESLITSRREQLHSFFVKLAPIIISRMREREENVRCDVLLAYVALLKQTCFVVPHVSSALWTEEDAESGAVKVGEALFAKSKLSAEQLAVLEDVHANTENLLKTVTKQMKGKSLKCRQVCCELLSQLARALPNSLSSSIKDLMSGIEANLLDKSGGAQIKVDTLNLITSLLKSHDPVDFKDVIEPLSKLVAGVINDPFYKVSSEALNVSGRFIPILKLSDKKLVAGIYDFVYQKLKVNDIDQDVKESAIATTATFISAFGPDIEHTTESLKLLVERLKMEMTRLAAVRALMEIAASPYSYFLEQVASDIPAILADFLKKNHRALKLSTLNLIRHLFGLHEKFRLEPVGVSAILSEISSLFKDTDLQVTQLALKCLTLAIEFYPQLVAQFLPEIMSSLIFLIQSALLQGATLQATFGVVRSLVRSEVQGKPDFKNMLDAITFPIYETNNLPKQAFISISAVVAVITTATNDIGQAKSLVVKLAEQLQNPGSTDQIRLFCIHAIGELGRRCPSAFDESNVNPGELMISAFNSPQEDLKAAAAHAIGALAVGNLNKYLPFILNQIQTEPKRQYLLLHSLKEVIAYDSDDLSAIELLKNRIDEVWKVLINHAHCAEEGTRNVVSECMGKLCVVAPGVILPKLKAEITSTDASIRACVVTSVKFMISAEKRPIDSYLQEYIGTFLNAIMDEELGVRRVALVVLNSAAHNKPSLINDLLPRFLPHVYKETETRKNLIREVEMGPFKHQVDDGLDLRKAAFECMYTLLESCLDRLDIKEFLTHVETGLKDQQQDIKLLTFLTIIRLANYSPSQMRSSLDPICEKIKEILNQRNKSNAVKQEVEKLEELKRAAIRALYTLQNIPEAEHLPQIYDLLNLVKNVPELRHVAEQLSNDSLRTFVGDVPMEPA
ncbi:unnamed protein product [Auanema sp. JU1783]|nr:unnamed protein product [Auanema sp. JU1783]